MQTMRNSKKHSDIFQSLSCLPVEYIIRVKKCVPPVIHPCHKDPLALQKPLKAELDRIKSLQLDFSRLVYEPNEWVSSWTQRMGSPVPVENLWSAIKPEQSN